MTTRTKSVLIYIGGVITGIIVTFIFLSVLAKNQAPNDSIVMFEKPSQEIEANSFEVIQVLPDGSALARAEDYQNWGMIVVLFLADEETSYYDNQEIKIPSGKHVMQTGTYRYITRQEMVKTVPVVEIMD